ncbi:unnamed protein product [Meloidogyne enterolobii]|uniref:Uncharacterized protein n=1 Tax=Meloidogyne enterolobii TaxID=390850 RepID=A0ACB1ATU3_MELEN
MFIFLGVIYLLITFIYKIVIYSKIDSKIKEFVTLIYTKFSFFCSIIYFLLLFIFTLIFFYLYLEDIITTCTEYRFVWAIFTLFMFVVILIGYFLHLRSACFV